MTRAEKRARTKHDEMSQSEAVLGLHRDADELAGAIRALKGTAAAALAERLATVLQDGEEAPDVEFLFELLGRLVKRDRDAVEEADGDRWVRGMDLLTQRRKCEEARGDLYARATWVRSHLVELYGSKRCRLQFGVGERTPRGAADLADETARLVRRLSSPDLRLPPPPTGLQPDREGWVAALLPRLERLETLLAEADARQRGAREKKHQERQIQGECRRTHKLVGRSLEALFTLAGEEMLAESLRSHARRRARRPNRTKASVVAQIVRTLTFVSIFEWLRRLYARLKWSPPTPQGAAEVVPPGPPGGAWPSATRILEFPRFFRWQKGWERYETPLPALARRS